MLKFSRETKISNVANDKVGECNQANNFVAFKDMKQVIHIGEPSNSKKICITPIQKIDCRMSGNKSQNLVKHVYQKTECRMSCNMSQHPVRHVYQKEEFTILGNMSPHPVTHDYQCTNFVYSIPIYYYKLYGRQSYHQHMYPQWNEKYERHHRQVWHDKSNILVHITYTSHKVFSCEDYHFDSRGNRHLIGERNNVTFYDSNKRKKFVNMKIVAATVEKNIEDHVSDIMDDIVDT